MSDTTITELELTNYTTADDFMVLDRGDKTYKIRPSNLGGLTVDSTIYVSIDGDDDANTGKTSTSPFKTIKRACKYADSNYTKKYTILVYAGEYLEENPIILPQNTSLIGNDSRSVTIIPKNKTYDILWVNNSCYVYGITFKDHLDPSSAIAFPKYINGNDEYDKAYNTTGLEIAIPENKPFITNGPYIRECNSITKGFKFPLQSVKSQNYNLAYTADNQTTQWINSLCNAISSVTLNGVNGFPFVVPNIASPLPAYEDIVDYFKSRVTNYEVEYDYYDINDAFIPFGVNPLASQTLSSTFFRDVRLILNSLVFDISANTNRLVSDVARNYYYNISSLMLPFSGYESKDAVIAGLDKLYTEIKNDIFVGVPTPYNAGTIPAFITKEFDILKGSVNTLTTVYYPITSAPDSFKNTAILLSSNSEFIQEEAFSYLDYNYFGLLDNADLLGFKNDTKEFINSIVNDLVEGSNSRTANYSYYYYDKIKSIIPSRVELSLDVFGHIFDLTNKITQNQSISALSYACGNGAKVDGGLVEGFFRNMTFESFSQINQGGKGVWITNNGNAQITNSDTKCCSESVLCENGGSCYIEGSHSTYGLSGLVATGYSPTAVLSANTYGTFTSSNNYININSVKGLPIYVTNLGDGSIVRSPYEGLRAEFRIDNNPLSSVYLPIEVEPELLGTDFYKLHFSDNLPKTIPNNTPIYFYIRSTIKANSHTFDSIGSGTFIQKATPALGGIGNSEFEVKFDTINGDPKGLVYSSSLNQTGDFKYGDVLKISDNTNILSVSGRVGINTKNPNTELTVNGSISANNNVFANNLFLSGSGTIKNDLTVYGNISASKDTFATNLFLSGSGTIKNDLNVLGSISANNNVFANNLFLSGSGTIKNDLNVLNSISANNNVFANNLFLSGSGTIKNDLTVYGNISASKDTFATNLFLSGSGTIKNDLNVLGSISANNNVFANNLFLSGSGTIKNDLNVLNSISANNNVFANNLFLSGSGTIKNDLNVLNSISANNNVFANNLFLSGNSITNGTVSILSSLEVKNGSTSLLVSNDNVNINTSQLTVSGSISSNQNVFSNNLFLSGSGIIVNDLTVYGRLSSNGGSIGDITGDLNVSGDIKSGKNIFADNLYLSGGGLIKNDLTVYGNISATGVYLSPATIAFTSSALFLENDGSSLVFKATQLGVNKNDIADFRNSTSSVLYVSAGGSVGILNDTPRYELDVNGNIAASNEFIYNSTERPHLTGVKQALDELLYTIPNINSLIVAGGNTLEVGQTLTTPTITWVPNKTINSYVLTLPDGSTQSGASTFLTYSDPSSYTVTTSISSITWSVVGTDWKSTTSSKSTTIDWLYKIYAGGILSSTPNSNDILTNTDESSFATNRTSLGSKTYVMTNEYWFVAYPKSLGTTFQLKINGLHSTDLASAYTIAPFTNASGGTTDYYFYRTNNKLTGTYTIEVL